MFSSGTMSFCCHKRFWWMPWTVDRLSRTEGKKGRAGLFIYCENMCNQHIISLGFHGDRSNLWTGPTLENIRACPVTPLYSSSTHPLYTRQGALTSTEHCGFNNKYHGLADCFALTRGKIWMSSGIVIYSRNAEDIRHSRITNNQHAGCLESQDANIQIGGTISGIAHRSRWWPAVAHLCAEATYFEGEVLELTTAARGKWCAQQVDGRAQFHPECLIVEYCSLRNS